MLVRTRFGAQNPQVTDSIDRDAVEVKRQTRKAWGGLAAIFLVLLGMATVAFIKDDPLLEDSWMMPERTPEGGANNPLAQFCKELEKPEIITGLDALKTLKNGVVTSRDGVKDVLSKNAELIAQWDRLVLTDLTDWGWPVKNNVLDPMPYIANVLSVGSNMQKARITLMLDEGSPNDAITLTEKTLLFASGIRNAESLLIQHLVAITVYANALSRIEDIAVSSAAPEDVLLKLQNYLKSSDPVSSKGLKLVMQLEYEFTKKLTDEELQKALDAYYNIDGRSIKKYFSAFYYKRNKASNLVLEQNRKLISALEKSDADFLQASREITDELDAMVADKARLFFNPNAFGVIASAEFYKMFHATYVRSVACTALHRLNDAMLALRRYELEQGKPPEHLSDLIPSYMDSVPIDPFSNEPIHWNPKTQRLYSVGENGVDDGGNITNPGKPDVDIGYYYWWGEEAKAYREKEKR